MCLCFGVYALSAHEVWMRATHSLGALGITPSLKVNLYAFKTSLVYIV